MRSRVHIKGHPIHPALVAFPIAFLFGSLLADAIGRIGQWPSLWTTGAYLNLAALATGLIAAVPGLMDYLYIVPPKSSGKRWATTHMIVNVAALLAFALSWLFRDLSNWMPGVGALALEGLGVALVTVGGWAGSTLVYRNQIAVDHRYAYAGKWQEQRIEKTDQPAVVAKRDELKVGQMKLLHVAGRRIVLGRTDEGYVAFDDRCSHRGGSLAAGVLACGIVSCPWHGSQFDARTGSVEAGPAEAGIAVYEVQSEGEEVRLTLPLKRLDSIAGQA